MRKGNALHQMEFKNLTKSQPLQNLFSQKNIKIDDDTYETLEKKYVSYREFPATSNSFFRVFYVEVFKFLISQFNQLDNFKQIMEKICCFEHMKECQVTCKHQHDKNELTQISEKIIKIIFGGSQTVDPSTGFQNFLEAVSKDEDIDKFGILLIRGNLYKRSFSNDTDPTTQAIDKRKKSFQKDVKNFEDPCDIDAFYQTIAAILFDIRMHIYGFKLKSKIPPNKVKADEKKVKIKLICSPKVICLLEKEQKLVPEKSFQVPISKQNDAPNEISTTKPIEEVKINRTESHGNGQFKKKPSFEIEEMNGVNYSNGSNGCRYCGSLDLLPTNSVCGNCYSRCHFCWSDSSLLTRYTCSHSFCYICLNQIFLNVDDLTPTICPSCQGLG